MSRLLVLGSGWIGSAVHRSAVDAGVAVEVVDPVLEPELSPRDARATDALRRRLTDSATTAVVNACGRVRGTDDELLDANLEFVRWLCASLAGSGVRMVHVGSASEYGDPGSDSPVDERAEPAPLGSYASSKAAGTALALGARERGLDVVVARVFNVVDDPVPEVSPVHQWLTELRALAPAGGDVEVWWPPTTRDFVALADVGRALVGLACAADVAPVVNVCSGVGLRFGEIVDALADALGVQVRVRSADRPGIEAVIGDPSLLGRTLGWVPEMSAQRLAEIVVPGGSPSSAG